MAHETALPYVRERTGQIPMTEAHEQNVTHRYTMHYPKHEPRRRDPHYKDFQAYKHRTKPTAVCDIGKYRNDFSDCHDHYGQPGVGLELHHAHIEYALTNAVDLAVLEAHYPGISNRDEVGEWVESAANLQWLCVFHHRGHGGVHVASSSDFEAERFVKGLIS